MLKEYKGRRNFKKSPEPQGRKSGAPTPFFVVQEHHASRRESCRSKSMARDPEPFPAGVTPQLPVLVQAVPAGDEWFHEVKWDGYRFLVERRNGKVRMLSRGRKDWTSRFPDLSEALRNMPGGDFLVDGEAVVLNAKGRSEFQLLQNWLRAGRRGTLRLLLFDALYLGGRDLRGRPLSERKAGLREWVENGGRQEIVYSDHIRGSGEDFYREACESGVEGVVSKRKDASYTSSRNRSWLKTKCLRRQEFVVVGFTPPSGSRKHFGALLLAARDGEAQLRYAGRAGTGFSERMLEEVFSKLEKLRRKTPPLSRNVEHAPNDSQWVSAGLVAEIAYSEITNEGLLRQAVFKGLREDKAAEEVYWDEMSEVKAEPPREPGRQPAYRGISVSNPGRVVEERRGITKEQLVAYYSRVAPRMLPYLKNRPLSLVRCPKGLGGACFFQKHFRESLPEHVRTVEIEEKGGRSPYAFITDEKGIVSLAQFGVIEFHTWGSRKDKPDRPDQLIFDLDPGPAVAWKRILGAAFLLRDLLADAGLRSLPKLTGGNGLHVCVPVARSVDWSTVRAFTGDVARAMVKKSPKDFIAKSTKSAREGKIFVDYLRNGYGATAVAPYSARARPGLTISVPVSWKALGDTGCPDEWNVENAGELPGGRDGGGDPWHEFFTIRQRLNKRDR